VFNRSSSADPEAAGQDRDARPPGLGKQFGRTRGALLGLIGSHLRLARTEFSEIGDQLKRVAMLAGIAFALLFLAGMTLALGLLLWLGDWVFGSIGWGALDGALLLIAAAVLVLLAVVDLSWIRATVALLVAVAIGVAVGLIVGLDWKRIADPPLIPAVLAGAATLAVLGGLLGAYVRQLWAAALGVVLGAILGALLGALGAVHPGPQVCAAVGLTFGLLIWPTWTAVLVFRHGVDFDKLKARFWPTATIETTKETIEWVRAQMPLARKP
jgi:hypothetical protein